MKDTVLDRDTAVMEHDTHHDYPKMCSLDGDTHLSDGYVKVVCVEVMLGSSNTKVLKQ